MAVVPISSVNDGDFATDDWPDEVTARLNAGCALANDAAAQSVSTGIGSLTQLTFGSGDVVSDPGSLFDNASDSIHIAEDGYYLVAGYVKFADDSTGNRRAAVKVESSNMLEDFKGVGGVAQPTGLMPMGILKLVAGDDVTLHAAQSSGGNLNVTVKRLAVKRLW